MPGALQLVVPKLLLRPSPPPPACLVGRYVVLEWGCTTGRFVCLLFSVNGSHTQTLQQPALQQPHNTRVQQQQQRSGFQQPSKVQKEKGGVIIAIERERERIVQWKGGDWHHNRMEQQPPQQQIGAE
jgi:hypothetical protein